MVAGTVCCWKGEEENTPRRRKVPPAEQQRKVFGDISAAVAFSPLRRAALALITARCDVQESLPAHQNLHRAMPARCCRPTARPPPRSIFHSAFSMQ